MYIFLIVHFWLVLYFQMQCIETLKKKNIQTQMKLDDVCQPFQPYLMPGNQPFRPCWYSIKEGHIPAINKDHYIRTQRQRRCIRATKLTDFPNKNIVENFVTNNNRCQKNISAKSNNFKNSFFPRTVFEWNKLENHIVNCDSVTSFRDNISGLCKFDYVRTPPVVRKPLVVTATHWNTDTDRYRSKWPWTQSLTRH